MDVGVFMLDIEQVTVLKVESMGIHIADSSRKCVLCDALVVLMKHGRQRRQRNIGYHAQNEQRDEL